MYNILGPLWPWAAAEHCVAMTVSSNEHVVFKHLPNLVIYCAANAKRRKSMQVKSKNRSISTAGIENITFLGAYSKYNFIIHGLIVKIFVCGLAFSGYFYYSIWKLQYKIKATLNDYHGKLNSRSSVNVCPEYRFLGCSILFNSFIQWLPMFIIMNMEWRSK